MQTQRLFSFSLSVFYSVSLSHLFDSSTSFSCATVISLVKGQGECSRGHGIGRSGGKHLLEKLQSVDDLDCDLHSGPYCSNSYFFFYDELE